MNVGCPKRILRMIGSKSLEKMFLAVGYKVIIYSYSYIDTLLL